MESWKADEKQMRWSKVRRKKMQLRESQKKEDTSAPNVREVAKRCVFPMIRVSGESKSRLVKAAGAESCGQRRNQKLHAAVARSTFWSENVQNTSASDHFLKLRCWKMARRCGEKHIFKWKCPKHVSFGPLFEVEMLKNGTPLWREAHFQVKMYKTRQLRTTFWSWDVEKLHAAVARSTFPSENVQNTSGSDHFLKLRCWKIARRCGEKHIFKWKCTKHYILRPLFEVQISKNCTPLWREAHFQVKMLKNWRSRSTFWRSEVEKFHAAVARSTFASQNVKKLMVLEHFLKFWCRKITRRCGEKRVWESKC